MIKIYAKNKKVFGNDELVNCMPQKAVIAKDNDDYFLDIVIPLNRITPHGKAIDYRPFLQQDNIIYVNTPWDDWQPFRMNNLTTTTKTVSCRAHHVGHDSKRFIISAYTVYSTTPDLIISGLLSAAQASSYFGYSSYYSGNISLSVDSVTLYDALRALEAKMAHTQYRLKFNGFNIFLTDEKRTYGYEGLVRDGKNLKDIEITESWDNVASRILALGKGGAKAGYIINSPYSFEMPFGRIIKYDDPIPENLAVVDITTNGRRYPKVNYKIDADVTVPVDVGDIIPVKHDKLGVDIQTEVISLQYDVLTKKYTRVEFGNFTPNIKRFATNYEKSIETIETRLEKGGL